MNTTNQDLVWSSRFRVKIGTKYLQNKNHKRYRCVNLLYDCQVQRNLVVPRSCRRSKADTEQCYATKLFNSISYVHVRFQVLTAASMIIRDDDGGSTHL
jgi:hypothetical protein